MAFLLNVNVVNKFNQLHYFVTEKSKAHILEMQKPENKDNKPDLKFFWREACKSSGSDSDSD